MKESYSPCKFCKEKELRGMEVYCKKFKEILIIGQLNSWESDYYQLPECKKRTPKVPRKGW